MRHDTFTHEHKRLTKNPAGLLRVGRDLDGIDYDFAAAFHDALHALRGIDPEWLDSIAPGVTDLPWARALTWEFYKRYRLTTPQFVLLCDRMADLGLLWCQQPADGSTEVWQSIYDQGHTLHVATDRRFGSHPAVSAAGTYGWLHRWRSPYTDVIFTPDKTELDVDVMIEDKLANYDAVDEAGTLVYLLDRPWNQDPGDDRRRIYSLQEYATRVKALAHARRVGAGAA